MERMKKELLSRVNYNFVLLLCFLSISIESIATLSMNGTENVDGSLMDNLIATQSSTKGTELTSALVDATTVFSTMSTTLGVDTDTAQLSRSIDAIDMKMIDTTQNSSTYTPPISSQMTPSSTKTLTVNQAPILPKISTSAVQPALKEASSSSLIASTIPTAIFKPNNRKVENCSGFRILDKTQQPEYSVKAHIKKCCPWGQNYRTSSDGQSNCDHENVRFQVPLIDAIFYENCIEDTEQEISLNYVFGNTCINKQIAGSSVSALPMEHAYIYSKAYGDLLYVLQNGSLLRVDVNFTAYDVFDNYCLDMDQNDKILTAVVCGRRPQNRDLFKAEAFLYAICMTVSVPCLLVTSFLYLRIRELRDLHGKALACHSIALAFGFLFLSTVQIRGSINRVMSYFIQYSMLSCFFWLAVMCADICIHIWWLLPRHEILTQKDRNFYFIMYAIVSFGLPLVLVHFPYKNRALGVPLSYLKGISSELKGSHFFFHLPITLILIVCLGSLIAAYVGFRVNRPPKISTAQESSRANNEHRDNSYNIQKNIDYEHFLEVKKAAKSTAFLYTIMTINTSFEIVMHYATESSADAPTPILFFDILTATQGIVIFIIFVCLPKPLQIVKRWWIVQGSLDLNMTEMETLNTVNIVKS